MKRALLLLAALPMFAATGCERPAERSLPPSPRTSAAARPLPTPQRATGSLATLDSIPDSVITARVRAALRADPALTGADISVNTDRGVVSLTGMVKDREQAAIASSHAQREDGVIRIDDHLALNAQ